jgi:hypothetical protein
MRTFWVPEAAPMASRRVAARRNPMRRLLMSISFIVDGGRLMGVKVRFVLAKKGEIEECEQALGVYYFGLLKIHS